MTASELTTKAVAERAGITVPTLRRWVEKKVIPGPRRGRDV